MSEQKLTAKVRRASPSANVIDLEGEISSFSEKTLSEAYTEATQGNIRTILLNFERMSYMNSLGIGLVVMLLIRARREHRKIVGYGLSEHYKQIFQLTKLDEAIPLYDSQEIALARAEPLDLPEREA